MARKSRKPSEPIKEKSSSFLEALRFLSLITKDIGSPNETHAWLGNKWCMASNGILTAASKIDEDIYACPHNTTLIAALSKCGQNMSITQLDTNRLSIKSDKFKAIVPCIDPTIYELRKPDEPIAQIDDRLKQAFEAVSVLATPEAQRIELRSILINDKSVAATTGTVIFEYWHGIDMPPNLAVPKAFADIIVKSSKKLFKFGYSANSVTFWFEDESWIKTQLYAEKWPNLAPILNRASNPFPISGSFWDAIAALQSFTPDGLVHFGQGIARSHRSADVGASWELAGVPPGLIFSAKQLMLIKPHAETIDFMVPLERGTCLMFFGKNIRGVIAGHAN